MLEFKDPQGRDKAIFHLSLVQSICTSFKSGLNQKLIAHEKLVELLKSDTAYTSAIMNDPAVKAFIRQTLTVTPSYDELSKACMTIKDKSLGKLWESYPSVSIGGTKFVEALDEYGTEKLSEFVGLACYSSLAHINESVLNRFNFLQGNEGRYSPLYTLNLSGNFIHMIDYGINFNGDDKYEDVLITFDLDGVLKNIESAIDFELNKLSAIKMNGAGIPDNLTHKDATYFSGLTITSNGVDMVSIPLTFDGYDKEADPATYSLDFRAKNAEKGGSAYTLDFDNLKVLDASSGDLLKLAKALPRSAARRLRGAALENDLGM